MLELNWIPRGVKWPDNVERLLVFTPSKDLIMKYRLVDPELANTMSEWTDYVILDEPES